MKKIILYIFLVLSIFGCDKTVEKKINIKPKGKILAEVNNQYLTLKEFNSQFSKSELDTLSLRTKQNFVKKWIDLTLFAEKAKQLKINENISVKTKVELAKNKILANSLLAFKNEKFTFKEEDLFKYYKIHKADFTKKIRSLKIQTIYVKTEEEIDQVRKELTKGKKISEVAKEYSTAPSASNGGFIGWRTKKSYNPILWKRLNSIEKHKYSIMELKNGYHLISWYKEKYENEFKPFSSVQAKIKEILIKQKEIESYKKTLKDLKKEFNTSISI